MCGILALIQASDTNVAYELHEAMYFLQVIQNTMLLHLRLGVSAESRHIFHEHGLNIPAFFVIQTYLGDLSINWIKVC